MNVPARTPRDAGNWAKPVAELHVSHELPAEALNLNLEGQRVAPLTGGFGKMWQKIYRVSLQGADVTPQQVVKAWKENFAHFWPKQNRFYGPIGEISPGDVALFNLSMPGRVKLSSGILVLYADDTSFSFITPEGHMFNGMITFSAREVAGVVFAQADGIIRAQDPLSELGMMLGGHRVEDKGWMQTLESLARYFGLEDAQATARRILVDRRRRWRNFGNIRRSAAIRSVAYMLGAPFRRLRPKPSA
jgi:hypothetical protein